MDLTQKSAIILGGAGGIGKEICNQMLARGLKKLAIIDMIEESEGKNLIKGSNVIFIYKKCSVADEEELGKVMTSIKNEFREIDIVVNSAGVLDEWNPKRTVDINYLGVVNSTLTAIKLMRKDKGGNGGIVINISSYTGLEGNPIYLVYSGTKHAVLGFTRGLRNEVYYNKFGIKFMTVCPGLTKSPMTTTENARKNHRFPELIPEILANGPNYQYQEADVVGKCILKVLDDGENGSVWQVDNNRSEKVELKDFPIF